MAAPSRCQYGMDATSRGGGEEHTCSSPPDVSPLHVWGGRPPGRPPYEVPGRVEFIPSVQVHPSGVVGSRSPTHRGRRGKGRTGQSVPRRLPGQRSSIRGPCPVPPCSGRGLPTVKPVWERRASGRRAASAPPPDLRHVGRETAPPPFPVARQHDARGHVSPTWLRGRGGCAAPSRRQCQMEVCGNRASISGGRWPEAR